MNPPPRVLIFPLPVQGHVSSMLKLAELLALSGIHVTFLNTEHVHNRFLRHNDSVKTGRFSSYPGFLFRTIPDGLSEDHPRTGDRSPEVYLSMNTTAKPLLKQLLVSGALSGSEGSSTTTTSPCSSDITCIIADGIFGKFIMEISEELRIPIIHFRTSSACCFWAYFSIPDIIAAGELPIKGEEDLDRLITSVTGMESFLRCRDLPKYCQVSSLTDWIFQSMAQVTSQTKEAQALILNTFEDLEAPLLSKIRAHCNPNTFVIGPLHAHLETRLPKKGEQSSTTSLFQVDESFVSWLDSQPPNSVIYVCFGSLAVMTRDQLMEFWHGLVNSKKRFLWAIRPDLLVGGEGDGGQFPNELSKATEERGFIAGWVPQEEVLSHPAVGGFLTHSGWNSTLESIAAGVPMICWPYSADQHINSRFVGEVWKLGIDIKDVCDRKVVEETVNDLMVEKKDEFARSVTDMARLAKQSVSEGGSSYNDFDQLISYIFSLASHE